MERSHADLGVSISSISFGAAEDYSARGGLPIISDVSPVTAMTDIAREGLSIPRDIGRGQFAIGAFVIGKRSLSIVVELGSIAEQQQLLVIRARCGD
jgi:hypothetical protein